MTLPASLLQQVEQHGCLTGRYHSEWPASICLGASQPPQPALFAGCQDCLNFKVGALQALLPPGTTVYTLADELTRHNRQRRGFDGTTSGYHTQGAGFWLSAAWYANCGLFLINGERSRALGSDLDLLMLAFKNGVVKAPDQRMLDPHLYVTQTVYVNYAGAPIAVRSRQDLLSSPQCRVQAHKDFHKATLAEFLPATKPTPPAPAPAIPVPRKPGDVCPTCKAEVRARALLNGTYVGCLC